MPDKEFNPSDFEDADNGKPVSETFEESIKTIDELPEDKKAEYSKLEASDTDEESPQSDEENLGMVQKLADWAAPPKVDITEGMRESFIRSLMGNQPYEHTFSYRDNAISLSFRTLSVKEHDAIAEAIAEYSKNEGFETATHLKFFNYKYIVACSLSEIVIRDEEHGDTTSVFKSPLEEYDVDFIEKEVRIQKMDGTTQTKVVKSEVKDRDRVAMAYAERFDNLDSNLYNLILNSHTEFDQQVSALALEMYKENFTQENLSSSP